MLIIVPFCIGVFTAEFCGISCFDTIPQGGFAVCFVPLPSRSWRALFRHDKGDIMGLRRFFSIKKKKRHIEVCLPRRGFNFIVEVFERRVFLDLWVHGQTFGVGAGKAFWCACEALIFHYTNGTEWYGWSLAFRFLFCDLSSLPFCVVSRWQRFGGFDLSPRRWVLHVSLQHARFGSAFSETGLVAYGVDTRFPKIWLFVYRFLRRVRTLTGFGKASFWGAHTVYVVCWRWDGVVFACSLQLLP
ncbi:hypothetical protein GE09DRAFT_20354 [Coniochaeta sp. 2T2.1]|nr:hypothetical protein GE09DRAFT_20354 [Coniochaeta sp. 2T2.1]